jgi:glutathione S-transferase
VQPVRWLIPENCRHTVALFRSAYPPGALEDAKFAPVRIYTVRSMRRRYGSAHPATILNRLAQVCDLLERNLGDKGWLVGDSPTVADFATWGFMGWLEELDGWETVRARRKLAAWKKAIDAIVQTTPPERPETYDAEDAAQLEARRHREDKKRLPLA